MAKVGVTPKNRGGIDDRTGGVGARRHQRLLRRPTAITAAARATATSARSDHVDHANPTGQQQIGTTGVLFAAGDAGGRKQDPDTREHKHRRARCATR